MPSERWLARDHHDGRVPADVGPDPPFEVLVAREPGLLVPGDGVHVGRGDGGREVDLLGQGPLEELHQQEPGPGPALGVDHGVEGVDPFGRLLADRCPGAGATFRRRARLQPKPPRPGPAGPSFGGRDQTWPPPALGPALRLGPCRPRPGPWPPPFPSTGRRSSTPTVPASGTRDRAVGPGPSPAVLRLGGRGPFDQPADGDHRRREGPGGTERARFWSSPTRPTW